MLCSLKKFPVLLTGITVAYSLQNMIIFAITHSFLYCSTLHFIASYKESTEPHPIKVILQLQFYNYNGKTYFSVHLIE